VWEVGTDAQFALLAKFKREKSFEAKAAAVELVEDKLQQKLTSLADAVAEYLGEVKTQNQRRRTSRIRTLCACSSKRTPTSTWKISIGGTCSPHQADGGERQQPPHSGTAAFCPNLASD
jgi:hypothetical protein